MPEPIYPNWIPHDLHEHAKALYPNGLSEDEYSGPQQAAVLHALERRKELKQKANDKELLGQLGVDSNYDPLKALLEHHEKSKWIPQELHSTLSEHFGPEAADDLINSPEADRPNILKVLQGLKDRKNWVSLQDLKTSVGANKEVPQDQVDAILDSNRKYGQEWQMALLRHPKVKLTSEQAQRVYANPDINSSVKAEAFLNHDEAGKVPAFLHPAHTNGVNRSRWNKLSDEQWADIITNSHKMDYDPSKKHFNYDTSAIIGNQLNNINDANPKSKTVDAILNHPSHRIASQAAFKVPLSDEQLDKLLARTNYTLDGKPLSEEDRSLLLHSVKHDDPEDLKARVEDTNSRFWKENGDDRGKILDSLVGNPNLNTQQVSKVLHTARAREEEVPGYHDQLESKLARHQNISHEDQTGIYSDPYRFIRQLQDDNHDRNYEGVKPGIKPEVFDALYPKMLQHFSEADSRDDLYNLIGRNANIKPEQLKMALDRTKQDLETKGQTPHSVHDIARHANATPDIVREAWNITSKPTEKEMESISPESHAQRKRNLATGLLSDHNTKIPEDLVNELAEHADISSINYKHPALKTEHLRNFIDKQRGDGFGQREAERKAIDATKDPEFLRELYNKRKRLWDAAGIAENQNEPGNRRTAARESDVADEFLKNPNTPSDVLVGLNNVFPKARTLKHPNFPTEELENVAANHPNEELKGAATRMLVDHDPDKYSYKLNAPGDLDIADDVHSKRFGRVQAKPGVAKLRVFRDKVLEMDPAKGELSPKQIGQGPFSGGWKPVQEKNGNISAKKIQELIDAHPSMDYNFQHEEWGGAQRHSEHPQRVFKLNATTDHIKRMKEAGVYDSFKKLTDYSEEGGHPTTAGHTIGWVRYEHHKDHPKTREQEQEAYGHHTVTGKPDAIHVDEIQTDLGPNTIAQLKAKPERAKEYGVNPDHLDKVNEILFGGHHPSEVLMESFRQHHRDQGRSDIPIHMLHAQTKAPISGMKANEQLPAHMKFTYDQMPKKMGFIPSKYGQTHQQDNPEIKPTPGSTWTDKIRKHEDDLLLKSLDDIKPGKPTHEFPVEKQKKLPPQVGGGRTHYFDYNHLLTPEHKRQGYQLYVRFHPESKIDANLFHKGQNIGSAEANYNLYDPTKLRIDSVAIGDDKENPKHRGKGLGAAMYEAVLAHAKHVGGVQEVKGDTHSSMAHAVHQKLARKHGLGYDALPNYMEGTQQHWPDQESWENHPSGPYDDKYGPYKFMLKSETKERPFRAAGFRDPETNEIFETGLFHDIGALPEHHQENFERLDQGFITHQGTFLNREQAAKYVNMKPKHEGMPTDAPRQWLDSRDNEAFSSKEPGVSIKKHEDGIMAMLESDMPLERILALKSSGVLPHHVLIGINDEDPSVRAFAASHPSINSPTLLHCLRMVKDPETAKMLLGHPACDNEHMNYAFEAHPEWLDDGNGGDIEEEDAV